MLGFSLCLLALASVGNAAIAVVGINYLYGTRFRGWWITGLRHLLQAQIVALPVLLWAAWGGRLLTEGDWASLPAALLAYLGICWAVAVGVIPYQTVRRWRRRLPACQLSNHTEVVDVARWLPRPPYGRFSLLARFPGNEIFQVEFVDKEIALSRWPACWDGLTILHVSDLHFCGVPDRRFYELVMDRIGDKPADLLAVTGDITDDPEHIDWIGPVLGRLRWRFGAFAVLGNHDAWHNVAEIRRRLATLGIESIGGRWIEQTIAGMPLVVAGNELPWLPPMPDLSDCPRGPFRLGLSHSPDQLAWARRNEIDLLLSGHNHGGQVRIPGFGPVLVPSKFSRRYDGGLFHEPPTLMYVSRGLGATYPLRLFCRPEITRLTLRCRTPLE